MIVVSNNLIKLMINVDTNTKTASGYYYADDGTTLGSGDSIITEIIFSYDDAKQTATIAFLRLSGRYEDTSSQLELIEFVNVSKIGSLKSLLNMKIDGKNEVQGNLFILT